MARLVTGRATRRRVESEEEKGGCRRDGAGRGWFEEGGTAVANRSGWLDEPIKRSWRTMRSRQMSRISKTTRTRARPLLLPPTPAECCTAACTAHSTDSHTRTPHDHPPRRAPPSPTSPRSPSSAPLPDHHTSSHLTSPWPTGPRLPKFRLTLPPFPTSTRPSAARASRLRSRHRPTTRTTLRPRHPHPRPAARATALSDRHPT